MRYELENNVATISMDDGKVNVVSHEFVDDMNASLDRAEAEGAGALILKGREGVFSAGFDLEEFKKGRQAQLRLAKRGYQLLVRLYSFPRPVVAACAGHGIGMGAFLVMTSDYRICSQGEFKFSMPETALGMELGEFLVALSSSRSSPKHLTRIAIQSEVMDPELAAEAGLFDEVVEAAELETRSREVAERLAELPDQYASNKLDVRAAPLQAMQAFLDRPWR
jgi:enoyl-CoA hydratase